MIKNPPANEDLRDAGSIPGSGRSPGAWHGNLLQYYCLENPMDRGAPRSTVHRVPESRTGLNTVSEVACQSESRSVMSDSATPWAIQSMGFSRPEYWSG